MKAVTKKTTINLILKHTYAEDEDNTETDEDVAGVLTHELYRLFTVSDEGVNIDVVHVDVEYKDWLEH